MKKSQKKALAVGAGVAAIAAAAAGTYLFAGKRGAKNRAKVSKWVNDAKTDVSREVNKMSKVTKQTYHKTVDKVLKQYQQLKDLDKSEIIAAAAELKNQWSNLEGQIKKVAKPVLKKITGKKGATGKGKISTSKKK